MQHPVVIPLFDSVEFIQDGNCIVNQYITQISLSKVVDAGLVMEHATDWLFEQKHSENNYKAYRSELTTFLHWCFDVVSMSPTEVMRKDMSRYVDYCLNPPVELIGYFNVPQFKFDQQLGERIPNPLWKPFVGKKYLGQIQPYRLSDNALKTKIAILSSFYSYLMGEEYCERNPAQIWLNHSRFALTRRYQSRIDEEENSLAFTELQWSYVMTTVTTLAEESPELHQRSLFLISLIYSCYLRISDVSARAGYSPVMGQFRQNHQTLFVRHRAAGRGRDVGLLNANLGIRQVRDEIQNIINLAADNAQTDGFIHDAQQMRKLTAHNIRHTGITHDININRRPLSHVQADAGHESIDTTSQYLHTTQTERHESALNKPLDHLQGINE